MRMRNENEKWEWEMRMRNENEKWEWVWEMRMRNENENKVMHYQKKFFLISCQTNV